MAGALFAVGSAAAQAPKASPKPAAKPSWTQMSVADAKKELIGVDLAGTLEGDRNYRWRECIDAKGLTLYQHDGIEEHGQLIINNRGEACFSYPPGNADRTSCFSVAKTKVGYDFRGFGSIFHATAVRRLSSCDDQNLSEAAPSQLRDPRHAG